MVMTFFHFLVAMAVFAILGVAAHVLRAVINPYPDRLSDKPWMDVAVSDGYTVEDHLLQVEFDEYGFYRLDSRRNLIVSVVLTMLGGFFLIAIDVAASNAMSQMIHSALGFVWDRIADRISELGFG
jgi:hypothetical protein